MQETSTPSGLEILREQVPTLPHANGVYCMRDAKGKALYVGKAKDVRKRVHAYTQFTRLIPRLQRMVMQIATLEIVTTHTEEEALLLEAELIKQHKPRYNILLRDDKTYPYIMITHAHDWPRIVKYRGKKQKGAKYFGPFAAAKEVNRAIAVLQKAFLLRSCSDHELKNRTRPCLEYQMKRCSAPCVGYVEKTAYDTLVAQASDFLSGKADAVEHKLDRLMQEASQEMAYEQASRYRDRLRALQSIRQVQDVQNVGIKEADVMVATEEKGVACVAVLFIRDGHLVQSRHWFPSSTEQRAPEEILEQVLCGFYQDRPAPHTVLLSHLLPVPEAMEKALATIAERPVQLHTPQRGEKKRIVQLALTNALEAIRRHLQQQDQVHRSLLELGKALGLSAPVRRVDVFDNSHLFGRHAVGAMVVATTPEQGGTPPDGLWKAAYRRYNVAPVGEKGEAKGSRPVQGGDDLAMMEQVLFRRYQKAIKSERGMPDGLPDVVVIDGGTTQLHVAEQVLGSLGLQDLPLIAIAKGPARKSGEERLLLRGNVLLDLAPRAPLFGFLLRLRDEVHRFAITGHRSKRQRAQYDSVLDGIMGLGPKRKAALLAHFGSIKALKQATEEEIGVVPGIRQALAKQVRERLEEG